MTALPSARASASASIEDRTEARPPAVTVTPAGIDARAVAKARVRATAPATETGPLDVEADGVAVVPEFAGAPVAPLRLAVALAFVRSAPTCWSTPLAGVAPVPVFFSGPPVLLASAPEDEVEAPVALNVTAPPACRSRAVVASTVSVAMVRASAMPTAALSPCESPAAVVVAVALWRGGRRDRAGGRDGRAGGELGAGRHVDDGDGDARGDGDLAAFGAGLGLGGDGVGGAGGRD